MSSLPAALHQVFSQNDPVLDPELIASGDCPQGQHLVMTLLTDEKGHVQVIFPAQSLCDIDRLNKALGRNLKPMPLADVRRLHSRLQLASIPPVPALTGYETVVDDRVTERSVICFESGATGIGLRLELDEFRQLTAGARWLDCAVPLGEIEVNFNLPERDRKQLDLALQRFTSLRIKQRLEDTLELPPLPETAQRIIHLRVDPNADVGHLSDIVGSDPSLAAQVVSWANSSFYAVPGQVRSIYDAIMRVLGFELVMNLAMGLALGRTLKQPRDLPEGLLDYWQQAIWIAQTAGLITNMMPRQRRPAFGLAYLAGLLHNFGYLVLAHVFPPHLSLICRYSEANRHVDTVYVEHYLLGITREQIASQLMDVWGMPEEVVVALRHQKNPEARGLHADYAQVLCLARQLLLDRGIAVGAPEALNEDLIAELGIDRQELERAMDELVGSQDDIQNMADMMRRGQ